MSSQLLTTFRYDDRAGVGYLTIGAHTEKLRGSREWAQRIADGKIERARAFYSENLAEGVPETLCWERAALTNTMVERHQAERLTVARPGGSFPGKAKSG